MDHSRFICAMISVYIWAILISAILEASWWPWLLIIPIVLAFIAAVGYLGLRIAMHCKRIQRERTYTRQKKIDDLIRNAETQNEYLHEGLINDDQKKIDLGIYGDYQPDELNARPCPLGGWCRCPAGKNACEPA